MLLASPHAPAGYRQPPLPSLRAQAQRKRPPPRKALSRRPDRVAESIMLGRGGKAPRAVNQEHIFGHVPGIKVGFKCASLVCVCGGGVVPQAGCFAGAAQAVSLCLRCVARMRRAGARASFARPALPHPRSRPPPLPPPPAPRAFLRSEALVVGLHRSPLGGIVAVSGTEARAPLAPRALGQPPPQPPCT